MAFKLTVAQRVVLVLGALCILGVSVGSLDFYPVISIVIATAFLFLAASKKSGSS